MRSASRSSAQWPTVWSQHASATATRTWRNSRARCSLPRSTMCSTAPRSPPYSSSSPSSSCPTESPNAHRQVADAAISATGRARPVVLFLLILCRCLRQAHTPNWGRGHEHSGDSRVHHVRRHGGIRCDGRQCLATARACLEAGRTKEVALGTVARCHVLHPAEHPGSCVVLRPDPPRGRGRRRGLHRRPRGEAQHPRGQPSAGRPAATRKGRPQPAGSQPAPRSRSALPAPMANRCAGRAMVADRSRTTTRHGRAAGPATAATRPAQCATSAAIAEPTGAPRSRLGACVRSTVWVL